MVVEISQILKIYEIVLQIKIALLNLDIAPLKSNFSTSNRNFCI